MTQYRPRSLKELQQHVKDIAVAFRIVFTTDVKRKNGHAIAMYHKETKQIMGYEVYVYPVVDEMTYAIAMHELGHCCAQNGFILPGSDGSHMVAEHAAWEWAKHQALDWSPAMEHAYQIGITSHERGAQQDRELKDMLGQMIDHAKRLAQMEEALAAIDKQGVETVSLNPVLNAARNKLVEGIRLHRDHLNDRQRATHSRKEEKRA